MNILSHDRKKERIKSLMWEFEHTEEIDLARYTEKRSKGNSIKLFSIWQGNGLCLH